MTNLFRTQLADGIMGMASTGHTVLNALRDHHQLKYDMYTLCLSHDGGFFSIGGYRTTRHRGPILWTDNASPGGKYYRVKIVEIAVNGANVNASPSDLRSSSGDGVIATKKRNLMPRDHPEQSARMVDLDRIVIA